MNISIFGLGYVGTVCAACYQQRATEWWDRARTESAAYRFRRSPIVEQDIDELINRSVQSGRLTASTDAVDTIPAATYRLCVSAHPPGD